MSARLFILDARNRTDRRSDGIDPPPSRALFSLAWIAGIRGMDPRAAGGRYHTDSRWFYPRQFVLRHFGIWVPNLAPTFHLELLTYL